MLTDRVLNKLANELGADWKNLLIHLDMKHNQMQLIEGNYQKDIHRQAFEALISWRDSQKSTEPAIRRVDRLKQASSTIERQDIVDFIESVLKGTVILILLTVIGKKKNNRTHKLFTQNIY